MVLGHRRKLLVCLQPSAQHHEKIAALYDLRCRFDRISTEERLILEAAIQMLEYMDDYLEMITAAERTRTPQDVAQPPEGTLGQHSQIRWTVDQYEHFIACGGFELLFGRLVPHW